MFIKLIVPEKSFDGVLKKEICIASTNFNLINLLDLLTDYTKVKSILKKYENSYSEVASNSKFDMVKDLYMDFIKNR